MNEKQPNSGPRRRLLKGLLLGGATSTYTLPEMWVKPLVASVIIPAHATTSSSSSCPTLTIPGVTVSCETLPSQNMLYEVDDRTGCPTLRVQNIDAEPDLPGEPSTISPFTSVSPTAVYVLVYIGITLQGHGLTSCAAGIGVPDNANTAVVSPVTSISGNPWIASYSVSGDENGLTVSDITLVPDS